MKKSNLGYGIAVILIASVMNVESGFASVRTLAGSNGNRDIAGSDSVIIKADNSNRSMNAALLKTIDGMDVKSAIGNQLRYPKTALENNVQGEVKVLCTLDPSGMVSEVKVLKDADQSLINEVTKAVRNVRFKPAVQNGASARYSFIVPVKFELID